MRKGSIVFLSSLLLISPLTGCRRPQQPSETGSSSATETEEPTSKEDSKEMSEFVFSDKRKKEPIDDVINVETDSFNLGGVVNGNYVNNYYNFTTEFEGWEFADAEDLDIINGIESFSFAGATKESVAEVLNTGVELAICYGQNEDASQAFEVTLFKEDTYSPIENIITQGLAVEKARLSGNGFSYIHTGRGTAMFRNKQVPCLVAEAESKSGRKLYETIIYIRDGQAILTIYALSFDEDKTNDILMNVKSSM